MSDTTPVTQESQQTFSLIDHLQHLLADVKAQQRHATAQAEAWRNQKRRSDWNSLQAAESDAKAEWAKEKATALEQTIAILSTLQHPDFWRIIREYTGEGYIFGVVTKYAHEFADMAWADTPIDALLKAYAALKPQEGAVPRKEDAGEAT